jgi:hypothetical protein
MFRMKAMLILTIADYPSHDMISGQVTKGYLGCTRCGPNVDSSWSKACKSIKILGRHRFFPIEHPYRHEVRYISEFNNEKELRLEPSFITTEEYLQWGAATTGYDGNNRNTEPTTINGVKRQSKLDIDLLY